MKTIVIKIFEVEHEQQWPIIKDEDMKLITHQEIPLHTNSPRHIQQLMAANARLINERRDIDKVMKDLMKI